MTASRHRWHGRLFKCLPNTRPPRSKRATTATKVTLMPDARPGGAPTVVIVDRDRNVRDLVMFLLKPVGFEVEVVETGYLALDRVRRLGRAIVITEIRVPELDGLALCRLLKSDPALRTVVVVLSVQSAADRARQSGADAFLLKPIDGVRLVSTILDVASKLATQCREST
ncbi:MAG TPA: response regulator, partial [Polyangiaceae bacterium]